MNWRFDRELLGTVWALAWPTVVYAVLQASVGLVDVFMVGHIGAGGVGAGAIAAVGFSRHILMLVMVGALAVSTGTMALVAQFTGAGKREATGRVAGQALILMAVLSVFVAVPGLVFGRLFLRWLGASGRELEQGAPYLRLLMGGSAVMFLNFAVASIFRGTGDTLTPLKIATGINLINVVGNYLFIFGPGPFPRLEVPGAAVGTLLARAFGAAIGIWLLASGRYKAHCRFDSAEGVVAFPLIKRMLNVGLPAGVQGFFRNGARLLFFRVVAGSVAGTAATAALTIGGNLRMFTIMPSLAFQVAATALVGQSIGAKDWDQAEGYGWETVKLCTVIMVVVSTLLWALASPIVALFTTAPDVVAVGTTMLRYFAVAQVFSAISITAGGSLIGAGDTRPPLLYTIISQWLLMLPLAWVLTRKVGLDPVGAWMAFAVAPALQSALIIGRFRSGKWKQIKV